jgi:5-methylcytosine-specific restriction endonuclease McrA
MTQTCRKCRRELPVGEFTRCDKIRWCRECVRDYNRQYRARHSERIKAYDRQRYAADIESGRAQRRASYRKHASQRKAQARQWYLDNKVQAVAARKRYLWAHPEEAKQYQRKWRLANLDAKTAEKHRRRARMLAAPGVGVTAADWRAIKRSSLGLCAYCYSRSRLSMDHIEPIAFGGAHEPDNIVAACRSCNSSKSDAPLIVWLARKRAA